MSENKVIVFETRGGVYECHRFGCQDVAKKPKDGSWVANSIADAKERFEQGNAIFIEETGDPNAGYHWVELVKVFPCSHKKVGA
jgi:hypothetical protein